MDQENKSTRIGLPDSYEYARWEIVLLIVALSLIVASIAILFSI